MYLKIAVGKIIMHAAQHYANFNNFLEFADSTWYCMQFIIITIIYASPLSTSGSNCVFNFCHMAPHLFGFSLSDVQCIQFISCLKNSSVTLSPYL